VTPIRTLRGRLAAAMLGGLVLAVAVSTALDTLPGAAPDSRDFEPYQDALVLAGFSLPALILIWLVSSWSLRPLARVSQEAGRVGPRDPAARLSQTGLPAEILPLVHAVNGALDRMADAMAAERRFTENAAHELRTPLTVLSLRLQRAKEAANATTAFDWPAIDQDLAQMNRLVSQLLDLARKENAGRTEASMLPIINLSRVAREACAMVLPMAEAAGRVLAITLPESLAVRGDANDMRDGLRNLLENAILHGCGTITVDGADEHAGTILRISDEGPGIAAGQEHAVFARFHKAGRSSGTGLGLAIVSEVVRRHGGTITIAPGPGCRTEIVLPAASSGGIGAGGIGATPATRVRI
jgi:signal transduction histidine kinase